MKTAIIDYGMGNLRSVQKAIEYLGFEAVVTADIKVLNEAERVILPGVGAIGQAMRNLSALGFIEPIKAIINNGKPFLGICLGMQILMTSSEEHGPTQGLGVIPGEVKNFRSDQNFDQKLVVPHMGWNDVSVKQKNPIFKGLGSPFKAYFVHSYYVKPDNEQILIGETEYGIKFCSALNKKNVFGIQFHPEKSGEIGLHILSNFLEL